MVANEESLLALLEIKEHLVDCLPEKSSGNKKELAFLWRDILWTIWVQASENGRSKTIKVPPVQLRERYKQIFP